MKSQEIKQTTQVGIFVLVGIILFAIAVFMVGKQETFFSKNFDLQTQFKDVKGLTQGNNVWFAGVKIGTVKEVDIISDTVVTVVMRIKENHREFIKENSVASIGSDGIVGNPIIVIEPGSGSQMVENNDVIASKTLPGTQDLINLMQTSGNNVVDITESIKKLMADLDSGQGTIGKLLTDNQLAADVEQTVSNLRYTGRNTANISRELSGMVQQMKNEDGVVNTLLTDTTFSKVFDQTLRNVQVSGDNTAKATRELNDFMQQIKSEENTLGVVLQDTTFANQLQVMMENLEESSKKLNEDLEAVQHNFLLRRYFKKKKKKEEKEAKEKNDL